jgi:hypothetical protein
MVAAQETATEIGVAESAGEKRPEYQKVAEDRAR